MAPSGRSRATSLFLDLYPVRIAERPDTRLLSEISHKFSNLPWENLTKYLVKHDLCTHPRPLDLPEELRTLEGADKLRLPDEVMQDHALARTGGTCFSLTDTLRRIVTDLGFRAWPAMGDMDHGSNVHCGLVVELDGRRFLLDPGYLVADPIPLVPGESARMQLPFGGWLDCRADRGCDEYELYSIARDGVETYRYRMRPGPVSGVEFLQHWIASFDAPAMKGLRLDMFTSEGRVSARNLNLRIDAGRIKSNERLFDLYPEGIHARFGVDLDIVRRAFEQWKSLRCRDR